MSALGLDTLPNRPRRRGGIGTVVLLLVLLAIAGAAYWKLHPTHGQHLADPKTVQLPPAAKDRSAVGAYFAGRGARLLTFATASSTFPTDRPADRCAPLAGELQHIAGPRALASLAAGTPDASLRNAAESHVAAVVRYVQACALGSGYADAVKQATFTSTVLRRMFVQNGVR